MTIKLYDSDNPLHIPTGVWAAGYVDGYAANAWNAQGWARFPNARRIAVFAATAVHDGDSFDCEGGNMAPWEVPSCVRWAHKRGIAVPWVYVNRANGKDVESALLIDGVGLGEVALWVATLDGTTTVTHWSDGSSIHYPVAAVQYLNAANSGGHYDISLVNDAFIEGDDMFTDDDRKLLQRAYNLLMVGEHTAENPDDPASEGYEATVIKPALDEIKAKQPTSITGTITGTIQSVP